MNTLLALILFPVDSPLALYATLFFVMALSGVGLPVPEEVTLVLGGYFAYLELTDFWSTLYILILGILAGDILGYSLGRFAGQWFYEIVSRFRPAELLLHKARHYFDKHGEKVLIFSRALIAVRVAVPILAGHFKMSFIKFLVYDSIAAIVWASWWVFISYYLGFGLDFLTEVREIKHYVVLGLIALIAGYALFLYYKERRKNKGVKLFPDWN